MGKTEITLAEFTAALLARGMMWVEINLTETMVVTGDDSGHIVDSHGATIEEAAREAIALLKARNQ